MSEQTGISTWPKHIYLQHGDELGVPAFHDVYANDVVTWCQDKIEAADVEYVRADIAAAQLAALIHIQQVACSGSPELIIATEAIAAATGSAA